MNVINYGIVKFKINKSIKMSDIILFRGYILNKFISNSETHNHTIEGNSIYRFPNIQYKIIDKKLAIVLYNNEINFLMDIYRDLNEIDLQGLKYIPEKELTIKSFEIKYTGEIFFKYQTVTYYLPFNQKNYDRFIKKNYTLEMAITNNLLESLKGLGIILDNSQKIMVKNIQIFKNTSIKNKNINFKAFKLSFETNLKLPNYVSIGKRKSIGFGMLKEIYGNNC